jgi:hypothetical protein
MFKFDMGAGMAINSRKRVLEGASGAQNAVLCSHFTFSAIGRVKAKDSAV